MEYLGYATGAIVFIASLWTFSLLVEQHFEEKERQRVIDRISAANEQRARIGMPPIDETLPYPPTGTTNPD